VPISPIQGLFKSSDYRCPLPGQEKFQGDDLRRIGWLKEAIQEGNNYLKLQRAYNMLDKALDVIGGIEDEPIPQSLSDIYTNRLKRQAREVVATISNMKPIWSYKTDNDLFTKQSLILNKLVSGWWYQTFADQKIKKAVQWAMISTGYIMPYWSRKYWRSGKGEIDLAVFGPRDVLPIQIGRDHDLQKAYTVIICNEVPIAQAHAMFPEFADKIKPNRNAPTWFNSMMSRMRKITSRYPRHLMDIVGGQKEDSSPSGPTVDIYYCYIMDGAINRTGKPVRMGKPGSSWHYEVPYLGQEIRDQTLEDRLIRPATEEDCKLYPLRRLMIATDSTILQDDTSPYWHGMVPLAKFTIDEWPDQFLGYSVIHDAYTIQKAMNVNLRAYQDYVSKTLRPDVTYDPDGRAKSEIKRYDPRLPGQKIPLNKSLGDEIGFLQFPPLQANILEFHEVLKQEMDHLMAIPDMKDLARANQIPAQDTLEKLMEIAGPVVQDMSRNLEKTMHDLGEMVKTMFYQFYTESRKVSMLGSLAMTEEDFQYDPGMLIPEKTREAESTQEGPKWLIPPKWEKARLLKDSCTFHIMPGSLHQITQTQYKLFLLQFWRDGRFPMDPQTVAEGFNMSNFGTIPGNPLTMLERWQAWTEIEVNRQVAIQMKMAQAQMQIQAEMAAAQQASGLGQLAEAAAASIEPKAKEGRPPTAQKPPHMETKEGGTRPTIAES